MDEKKEQAAFRRALAEEMMRAAPEMIRKHRQEAANRADIERRVQGCRDAIEERRKDYAAQMKRKGEAARALYERQRQDLRDALASGSGDAFAAALAAMTGGSRA